MASGVKVRSSKLEASKVTDQSRRESCMSKVLQPLNNSKKTSVESLLDGHQSVTAANGGRNQGTAGATRIQGSQHHASPADSLVTQPLTESSAASLQEMFDEEDFNAESVVVHDSTELLYQSNFIGLSKEADQWLDGDGGLLDEDDAPSFTPPLSLYAGTKYAPPTTVPESSCPSSLASSGMNTLVSEEIGINSIGDNQSGSCSSNTTSSVSRSNRPILYSAIGSLENFNASSFRDLSKRVGHRRDFSKIGASQTIGPSALLGPLAVDRDSARESVLSAQLAGNSHDLPSHEQPSLKASLRSNASSKATPPSSNPQRSLDVGNEQGSHQHSTDRLLKSPGGKPSNLKKSKSKGSSNNGNSKKVSVRRDAPPKKPVEMFRPSCDAYTPRIEKKRIEYRKAEMRTPVQKMASPMGTLSRPNFRDALRRVAMIIHKHIVKIEGRFERYEKGEDDHGLFKRSMRELFSEDNYCTPTYRCTMVRIPMARPGMVYGLRKIKNKPSIPSEEEIFEFAHQLFKAVQLSSECSIVCLIYVERLMETAKVPLVANTWRPIFMCGLLLASKVWQDLSSWNIEFASVYPQYSLEAVNRLELNFLRNVKWDLYISTSLYAKYYFALRSLVEKVDFRQRYNRMVGGVDNVAQSEALKISKRTEQFKEETILQLSRSM